MGKYAALAIMLAITISMVVPVYASEVIELTTNKKLFKQGDSITVTGKTKEAIPNTVNIVFIDPNGAKQISGTAANSSGHFSRTVDTSQSPWKAFFKNSGIYNVTAFLNDEKFEEAKLYRFDFSLDGSPITPSAFSTPQQTPPPKQNTTTTQQPQQQSSQNTQTQTELKKEFLKYVDSAQNPQYYIDRYNNEPEYKKWFDTNFPGLDIYTTLGVSKPSPPKSEPPKTEPEPAKPEPEPAPQEPKSTPKETKLAPFVDPNKDPQSYIDRYNKEPSYKTWFDKNYPDMTIYEAVGLETPKVKKLAPFVDPNKDPQSYIDRYNNEPSYKTWFDKSYPDMTIYEAVGVDPPKVGICGEGTQFKDGVCVVKAGAKKSSGGCLIATATYGTELAPQVQQLRELRDNSLLNTESGSTFMAGFNEFYYSFSPTIADMERQNPVFREAVKLAITPMVSTLSILNYVDMDSDASVIGYGLAIIALNIGMYFVAPAIVVYRIKNHF